VGVEFIDEDGGAGECTFESDKRKQFRAGRDTFDMRTDG
jgi:hypothetical protein